MTEEEKRKHKAELLEARIKRYHAKNNIKRFSSLIDGDILEELNKELQKKKMSKKQFLEQAIDRFLKGE